MTTERIDLAELTRPELEAALASEGVAPFHARRIYRWIHRRGVTDFAAMTDLSRALRATLAERAAVSTPVVTRHDVSTDGTAKFLLRLADGR